MCAHLQPETINQSHLKLIGRGHHRENFIYRAEGDSLFPFVFSLHESRLYLFSAARKGHDSHKLNAARSPKVLAAAAAARMRSKKYGEEK